MKYIPQAWYFTTGNSYKLTLMFLLSSFLPFGKGELGKKIKGRDMEKEGAGSVLNRKNRHQIEME